MEQILVDGHYYYVDTVTDSCDGSVHLEVFDIYNDRIGTAVVNHDIEQVLVHYTESEVSTSYNYFELKEGHEGLMYLAEWIVATDPMIS